MSPSPSTTVVSAAAGDAEAPYPGHLCVHGLVEAQAATTPDAVALIHNNDELTYAELNRHANQFAHYLQARGVGPEVLVGLCVERSFDLIVGLLGILKAGGAYLPLDPAYPQERLEFMLTDSGAELVVTTDALLSGLPEPSSPGRARLVLDRERFAIKTEPTHKPAIEGLTPDNLMYVMYTSGSTGRPKGVLVTHRGAVSLSEAGTPSLVEHPGGRVLQFHSPSFDPSVWELLISLTRGRSLVLGDRASLAPGRPLVDLLGRHRVETMCVPASVLAVMPVADLPDLTTIFLEGEVPQSDAVRRWAPGRRLYNTYGPTEASMWCIGAAIAVDDLPPPIGRPIANVRIRILDSDLDPVPFGDPGELFIGGVGLARGYLKRPDLTAERFVPDPFSARGGERLYRTGDIGRFRADGQIEFLGRVDDQVKVRGHRVEVAEIEALLVEHTSVRDAVVVPYESADGLRRLIAYVVPRGDVASSGELRDFIKARLPDYMIPAAFMSIDELPLSSNGKLDRSSLPPPDTVRPQIDEEYVVPDSETQATIATIWRELLELERVGVNDDFFELGGDSLMAVRMFGMIEDCFGVVLPFDIFLDASTIRDIAARVDEER